jgi:hypothetical protein
MALRYDILRSSSSSMPGAKEMMNSHTMESIGAAQA